MVSLTVGCMWMVHELEHNDQANINVQLWLRYRPTLQIQLYWLTYSTFYLINDLDPQRYHLLVVRLSIRTGGFRRSPPPMWTKSFLNFMRISRRICQNIGAMQLKGNRESVPEFYGNWWLTGLPYWFEVTFADKFWEFFSRNMQKIILC